MAAQADDGNDDDPAAQRMITLNFPENVELKVLIDYVSRRLNLNILYDEQTARRRVSVRSPAPVPETSLLGLLRSVLKMNDLALVASDEPGWWRIAPAQDLAAIARLEREGEELAPTAAVTRVLQPRHVEVAQFEQVIRPFLTPRGAGTIQIADQNVLIVTDYSANIERVVELMAVVDLPSPDRVIRFHPVEHLEAAPLATQLSQLLAAQHGDARGVRRLEIRPDARTNRLILIGTRQRVEDAIELAGSLDIPLALETRLYPLTIASPERLDRILQELTGELRVRQQYRSSVDREANLLIVTATAEIHQRAEELARRLDVAPRPEQSPIRFYKIRNSTAVDILATIRAIEGEGGIESLIVGDRSESNGSAPGNRSGSGDQPSGSNPAPGPEPNAPPGDSPPLPTTTDGIPGAGALPGAGAVPGAVPGAGAGAGVHRGLGRVTADHATNSLIVVGEPAVQQVYAQLIELLDRRRPQVLIEVTLVTLDTSGGHSVGVEIGRVTDIGGDGQVLTFSSFGLSDVNPTTGQLAIRPGLGFNGAVLSPDIADIVIRAVATDSKAQVVSAPKILVNDNATGILTSVNEAPFTSINASQTVATTSFAGFASAGTTISMTPHISEGDHLHLRYSVNLSSFTGESADGVPPPRQTNTVTSEITIPDGHTIVIGGLNRRDSSESATKIPILGDLPALKHLFRSQTVNHSDSTLFAFVRPVILRDDEFRDLKHLSRQDARNAGIPADYPESSPMLIK
ncbi:MAG: hypothetical protein JJU36_05175 [Phycisphaeraceae bacterium]|nr:hypothetical protein [Phycisphaeraceae bacterium]